MAKRCEYYSDKRCYHSSCSIFDPISGEVSFCPLFRGGSMFTRRKVSLRCPS